MNEVFDASSKAVEFPNHQDVSGAHELQVRARPGRSARTALSWSSKIFSQPACLRASRSRSRFDPGSRRGHSRLTSARIAHSRNSSRSRVIEKRFREARAFILPRSSPCSGCEEAANSSGGCNAQRPHIRAPFCDHDTPDGRCGSAGKAERQKKAEPGQVPGLNDTREIEAHVMRRDGWALLGRSHQLAQARKRAAPFEMLHCSDQ
jgi:hypothetical protein